MNRANLIMLRPFQPADADACLALFRDCVRRVNIRDYTKVQVDAWASADINKAAWSARFDDRLAYVVVENNQVIGFGDMTRGGHLDRLFVSADHQRRGIARRIVEQFLHDAVANNVAEITSDVSITAKPFFQRMGFDILCEQSVDCRGVKLTNYRMQKIVDTNVA